MTASSIVIRGSMPAVDSAYPYRNLVTVTDPHGLAPQVIRSVYRSMRAEGVPAYRAKSLVWRMAHIIEGCDVSIERRNVQRWQQLSLL